jgi:hypothetical protein
MASCESIRPLLFKVSEQEASPREAMRVASHLAGCTGCKILLARERRLARMLEVDLLDIPVSDDFFHSVMASLPSDPPPAAAGEDKPEKKKDRNGMRLAGLAGLIGAGTLLASRLVIFQGRPGLFSSLPPGDFETAQSSLEGLVGIVKMAAVALEGATSGMGFDTPFISGGLGLIGGLAALLLLLAGASSTLVALVARSWVWPGR